MSSLSRELGFLARQSLANAVLELRVWRKEKLIWTTSTFHSSSWAFWFQPMSRSAGVPCMCSVCCTPNVGCEANLSTLIELVESLGCLDAAEHLRRAQDPGYLEAVKRKQVSKQRCDIFLSFAQEDREFAEEVKLRLQTKKKLKPLDAINCETLRENGLFASSCELPLWPSTGDMSAQAADGAPVDMARTTSVRNKRNRAVVAIIFNIKNIAVSSA
eukprot:Em0024g450a